MKQNFNRVLKAELIGYMKEKLDRILNGEELKEIQWQLNRYEWHDLDAKQSALKKINMILGA